MPKFVRASAQLARSYAARHGYEYILDVHRRPMHYYPEDASRKSVLFLKVLSLMKYASFYDAILYLDLDAVVLQSATPVESWIRALGSGEKSEKEEEELEKAVAEEKALFDSDPVRESDTPSPVDDKSTKQEIAAADMDGEEKVIIISAGPKNIGSYNVAGTGSLLLNLRQIDSSVWLLNFL